MVKTHTRYQKKNIHPITPILIIRHPLSTSLSTTIHTILLGQFTCLTVFFHNLSPGPLWSSSWSGAHYFIPHAFLHPIIIFPLQHMPTPSQHGQDMVKSKALTTTWEVHLKLFMTLGFPGGGVLPFELGIFLHEQRARNGGVSDSQGFQQSVVYKHVLLLQQQQRYSIGPLYSSNIQTVLRYLCFFAETICIVMSSPVRYALRTQGSQRQCPLKEVGFR